MGMSAESQVKKFVHSKMTKCLVMNEKIITLHKRGLSNVAIAERLLESKTTISWFHELFYSSLWFFGVLYASIGFLRVTKGSVWLFPLGSLALPSILGLNGIQSYLS